MKMTRQLLRDVGVCATYVRRFSELFPTETYPDGVELNQETCTQHANDFDWQWAVSEFLSWNGRMRHEELVASRSAEARAFGTGITKKAALFGYLFDEHPEFRNERVVDLARTADERADQRALEAVDVARRELDEARHQVEYWTGQLPRRERRLAEATTEQAGALRRQAARTAAAATERVARLGRQLADAQTAAEAAAAALAELPAPEPAPAPETPAAEPTPAPADPTDEPARSRDASFTF
jgi:hypothetical protein